MIIPPPPFKKAFFSTGVFEIVAVSDLITVVLPTFNEKNEYELKILAKGPVGLQLSRKID